MASDTRTQGLPTFFKDPNVRFPSKPRLVADLNVLEMPRGLGFQFRGGPVSFAVRGRESEKVLSFLLPRLDGKNKVADLLSQSPSDLTEPTILKALRLLHMKGVLTEGGTGIRQSPEFPKARGADPISLPQRELLFWGRKLGVTGYLSSGEEAPYKLRTSKIILIGTGLFGLATYDLLTRSGCIDVQVVAWDDDGLLSTAIARNSTASVTPLHFPTTAIDAIAPLIDDLAGDADLVVLATRNAARTLGHIVNRSCLDAECPYVRADEDGTDFEIGPYVVPYGSACYTCMELRESSVQEFMLEEALYQKDLAEDRPAGTSLPLGEIVVTAIAGASLLALEVVRILTGIAGPTLLNTVLKYSVLTGTTRSNRILRVPRCPDCSRGTTHESKFAK